MTEICDACPVRRQTYGYLPSRETLSANRRQTVRSANNYFSCGILEMYRIPRCRRHIGTRHITVGISSAVLTARRPWLLIIWAFVGASTRSARRRRRRRRRVYVSNSRVFASRPADVIAVSASG